MKPHDEKLKSELVSRGLLTEDQAKKVAGDVLKTRASFKECLLKTNLLKEEDIVMAEADVLGVAHLDLNEYLINEEVIKHIPESVARTHLIVPVFKTGSCLTIATADPLNLLVLDEVRTSAGQDIEMVMSTRETIRKAIDQYYGVGGNLADVAKNIKSTGDKAGKGTFDVGKAAEEAPIIKLVNLILLRALDDKASDVHIEPEESMVRVRNRVDGVLKESTTFQKNLELAVASRIKIMAKLDISESRKPQDGKIRLRVENRELDIRVSTLPTTHGENIVMRLLEQSKVLLGLKDLGFEPDMLSKMDGLVHKAYGIVLVTGPTGAGKTTTLYAALNTINTVDKNIITIEDPVEYQIPMIRQTQVNAKAGLTFATGLRSILRQDPDVILVGEIRDAETADVAIKAALTGHLVFSTIHTNDAAGAVSRLIDMQIEPFLISSAIVGVLAQRLVRTVCQKCKEPSKVDPELLRKLGFHGENTTFYKGKGCSHCKNTGYAKRVGIFELMAIDEDIRNLILKRGSAGEIKTHALKNGMASMRSDGLRKAAKGITTLEEVLKVTLEEESS